MFDLPDEWHQALELVVEVWTIQSLSPQQTGQAIDSIATLVANSGTLLVSALTSDGVEPPQGPPWPVHPKALDGFIEAGLVEVRRVEQATLYPSVGKLEVEYRRDRSLQGPAAQ